MDLDEPSDEGDRHRLTLVVAELVGNSVRHAAASGGDPITLDVYFGRGRVRVEVTDRGAGFERPPPPRTGEAVDGGWGLVIIDSLSDRWGVDAEPRTRVWCELVIG